MKYNTRLNAHGTAQRLEAPADWLPEADPAFLPIIGGVASILTVWSRLCPLPEPSNLEAFRYPFGD
jgi:hypothetical protein